MVLQREEVKGYFCKRMEQEDWEERVYPEEVVAGGGVGMRVIHEGKKSYNGEFSLDKDDEFGNANLEVTCCDQTCPKDGHNVASTDLPIPDGFQAEPESLNKHGDHHKLCSCTRHASHSIKLC